MRKYIFIFTIMILLLASTVHAQAFGPLNSTCWDKSTATDLKGFKIYFGSAQGVYGPPIDVGLRPGVVLNQVCIMIKDIGTMPPEGSAFFTVTAYDTAGNESAKPPGFAFPFDSAPPNALTNLLVK